MSKKVILYGSLECPGCNELKAFFESEGVKYGFVDILSGLAHIKKFLNVRDANPDLYAAVREHGGVGIPTVVVDDKDVYLAEAADFNLDWVR